MRFKKGDSLGKYKITACIGAGGMGEVYEVRDEKLGVVRALKTFESKFGSSDSLRKRFCAEACALCQLAARKPHDIRLPSVYDYFDGDDALPPYFVMDCVRCKDGVVRNLARAKDDCLANCDETIAGWFVDVCLAVRFLHAENKLHRDIKPENILLDADGHAVLADFGTLRFEDADERQRMNIDVTYVSVNSREQFGTRRFWAPEIIRGEAASKASDCYALGATFWWLLKGSHYDPSKNPQAQWASGDAVDPRWAKIIPRLVSPYVNDRLTDLDECISIFSTEVDANGKLVDDSADKQGNADTGEKGAGQCKKKSVKKKSTASGSDALATFCAIGAWIAGMCLIGWLDWMYARAFWYASFWDLNWFTKLICWPLRIVGVVAVVAFLLKELKDWLDFKKWVVVIAIAQLVIWFVWLGNAADNVAYCVPCRYP